jgi:hypothetical protein
MMQEFDNFPRLLVLTIALLLSLNTAAFAQEITGNIVGTVKDSSGAAVKGAVVTITDEDKNLVVRTVTTGDEGEFSAPQLQAGNYSMTTYANVMRDVQPGNANSRLVTTTQPNGSMYRYWTGNRANKANMVYQWIVSNNAQQSR